MKEGAQLCLDTLQADEKSGYSMGVYYCQGGGSSAQVIIMDHEPLFPSETTVTRVDERRPVLFVHRERQDRPDYSFLIDLRSKMLLGCLKNLR